MSDFRIPTLTRHNPYDQERDGDPGKRLLIGYTVFVIGVAVVCSVVSWVWGG